MNKQAIYTLLREFDSTVLEKFGFGSCNLSLKAQVSFMTGFISLTSSFCKDDIKSSSTFSDIEIAEMEEEDALIDLQEKLAEDFNVDYQYLVDKSKEELSEMLKRNRSLNSRKTVNHT